MKCLSCKIEQSEEFCKECAEYNDNYFKNISQESEKHKIEEIYKPEARKILQSGSFVGWQKYTEKEQDIIWEFAHKMGYRVFVKRPV